MPININFVIVVGRIPERLHNFYIHRYFFLLMKKRFILYYQPGALSDEFTQFM